MPKNRLIRPLFTLTPFVVLAAALAAPAVRGSGAVPALAPEEKRAAITRFEREVRPLLAQHCYPCHGAKVQQAGLRLDTRSGLSQGTAEGHQVVVPGNPDASRLIQAVRYQGAHRMPPSGRLPERAVAALTEWVRAGAVDPREDGPPVARKSVPVEEGRRRWAFQPLVRPALPPVRDAAWVRNPVDRFILARLEARGMRPNSEADRRTLLRRAAFDLTGLPPSPEEIAAFAEDASPDAWTHAVQRLLASPHYGERWARHWLDLARFAESHGYEQDYDRPNAFHYRDFVIRALNQGMPYDEFVRLQIAGDEIAPTDPLALAATGYLAAGTHSTQITKNQVEKERYDELDDMASNIGTTMLGLTVGCARCHDHKFDPIPTRDYYRLVSTFTRTVRSDQDVLLDPEGDRAAATAWEARRAELSARLETYEREALRPLLLRRLREARTASAASEPPRWRVATVEASRSEGGAVFTDLGDGSLLVSGTNAASDTYTLSFTTDLSRVRALRVEALAHPSMVRGGPGRASNGNFDLTDVRVSSTVGGAGRVPVRILRARADFEQSGLPISAAIDDNPASGWAIDPQFGRDHAAVFDLEELPGSLVGRRGYTVALRFAGNTGHNIGRVRLSVSAEASPRWDGTARQDALQSLIDRPNLDEGRLSAAELRLLASTLAADDPGRRGLAEEIARHAASAPQPRVAKILICSEGVPAVRTHTQGGDFLEQTHYLKRGDPNQKGEVAAPGFLQVLMRDPAQEARWRTPPPPGWRTSHQRLGLARWLTDSERGAGHLLARVIVNRLWQHHFGRGIVATPSDFGAQGDPPSHPELLEFLASELIRGGWKLKPIHELIMQSAAYRQTSSVDPRNSRLDPGNRWFSRQNRRRLEAEAIRDSILQVSGRLDPTAFGPGTLDDAMTRRSIYFTVKRSRLVPWMMVFDAPDALSGIAVRPTTTVAPQALLLLNNPQVRLWAEAFARRVTSPEASPAEQVTRAYRLALGRAPDGPELREQEAFLRAQSARYRVAGRPDPATVALADLCHALFCLNEFVVID